MSVVYLPRPTPTVRLDHSRAVGARDLRGPVAAAAVDDDDLDLPAQRAGGIDGCADTPGFLERGHDDRERHGSTGGACGRSNGKLSWRATLPSAG